jgi:plasmid stabilization system protein ParE
MIYRIALVREAVAEAEHAAAWYELRRSGLGADFVAELAAVLDGLTERPLRHPPSASDPTYRCARLRRFPFSVFFSVQATTVEVVAIAHARRRPGYWR